MQRICYFITIIIASFWILNAHAARPKAGRPVPVTATTAKVETVQDNIEAIGTTKALESVTLTSNITETVEGIYFEDGQVVKKGQLLVQMRDAEEIANLREIKHQITEAQKQFSRTSRLSRQNIVSKSENDRREALLRVAEAKARALEARIRDLKIVAPFDGVLGFRQVSVGTLVQPGTAIATIDAINPIKVDFTLSEKYLSKVYNDQPIIAHSTAYPKRNFAGKIRTINHRIDPISRSFTVRALIENNKSLLKPGMLLDIAIKQPARQNIVLPESALVPIGGKQYVFVVLANGTVQRREINLGLRAHGKVEVTKGIKPGEKIVLDGGFKLRSGQRVHVLRGS